MLEVSGFVLDVVGAACSLNVFIVLAAFEDEVSLGGDIAGIRVVSDFVGGEGECVIVDFDIPAQPGNVAFLLLADGTDFHRFCGLICLRRCWSLAGYRGKQLAGN